MSQLLGSLTSLEIVVKDAIIEHQQREVGEKAGSNYSQKEKTYMLKVQEKFLKDKCDEFYDTYIKVRNFLTAKIEKNWKRVNEKLHQQKTSAEDF